MNTRHLRNDNNNLKDIFTWYCWICLTGIRAFRMNSRYYVIHWKWGGCVTDSLYSSSVLLADAYRYDSPIGRQLVHSLWYLLQHFISNQHALRLRRVDCLHNNDAANAHAPFRKHRKPVILCYFQLKVVKVEILQSTCLVNGTVSEWQFFKDSSIAISSRQWRSTC